MEGDQKHNVTPAGSITNRGVRPLEEEKRAKMVAMLKSLVGVKRSRSVHFHIKGFSTEALLESEEPIRTGSALVDYDPAIGFSIIYEIEGTNIGILFRVDHSGAIRKFDDSINLGTGTTIYDPDHKFRITKAFPEDQIGYVEEKAYGIVTLLAKCAIQSHDEQGKSGPENQR